MARWLELTPDYRCNNHCLGCYAVQPDGPAMSTREAVNALVQGRREGARWLWLGGGDATLRRDLFAIVTEARRLGYERVKLETNAMLLAYPAFARRCSEAGVTEVAFAIKGATAATHDRLTRTPGCHALLLAAIAEVRALGLAMEGDVLVYASNADELPAMVQTYAALGLSRFRIWLLSAVDDASPEVAAEVPRISQIVPRLLEAMDAGALREPGAIVSLHTPPCTVPVSHHACLFDPAQLDLVVVNPGGHRFRLEDSPIEGGTFLPTCEGCALRPRCRGVRRDYLALHGDGEFRPPA